MINKIQELSFEFMILKESFLPKRISSKRINAYEENGVCIGFFFFHKLNI